MTKQEQIIKQNKINELLNSLDDDVKYPILHTITDELGVLLNDVIKKKKKINKTMTLP